MSESSKTKGKAKGKRKGQGAKPADSGMSCLNAAAKVLAEKAEPMNCKEMVEAMAAKGYWTTPGGKTPHATLAASEFADVTPLSRVKVETHGCSSESGK